MGGDDYILYSSHALYCRAILGIGNREVSICSTECGAFDEETIGAKSPENHLKSVSIYGICGRNPSSFLSGDPQGAESLSADYAD
jgi:hypothetical protein